MMPTENKSVVDTYKKLGNDLVRQNKFDEAIIHYTSAIKLDPDNYILYSNRSLAYLKTKQYQWAFADANEAIRLNSKWPKGYFRKGEVEYATEHYSEAYESYLKALWLKSSVTEALEKTSKAIIRQNEWEKKIPWVGAGMGIVCGVTMLVTDSLFTLRPTHPLLMAVITIFISLVGYGLAKYYLSYSKYKRNQLLKLPSAPENIEECSEDSVKESTVKRSARYTRSQARRRYRNGKL